MNTNFETIKELFEQTLNQISLTQKLVRQHQEDCEWEAQDNIVFPDRITKIEECYETLLSLNQYLKEDFS